MSWLACVALVAWALTATATSIEESFCCTKLKEELPSIVHWPFANEYKDRRGGYYSIQQQELIPHCTVAPTTSQQVSSILQLAHAHECQYTVASGGHMSWKGSSSTDEGFVIDLRSINHINVSLADQTVKLGPGSTWKDVYGKLSLCNLTTPGGRIGGVGVGGFLLGGGISFFSMSKGFATSSIISYEVVLSNGTIILVHSGSHADLFWALKLGSTNFGIVTHFEMEAVLAPAMWGLVNTYTYTDALATELLTDFEQYAHNNEQLDNLKSILFVRANRKDIAVTVQANVNGVAEAPMTGVTALQTLEDVGNTHDVVTQVIAAALESEARAHWFTFTTKVGTDYSRDLRLKAGQVFKPLDTRKGMVLSISHQSFKKSFIEGTAGSPVYDAMNRSGEDLVCMLFMLTWSDPADDVEMATTLDALGAWAEEEARKRSLLEDFVYLNYANARQPVYERSLTRADLDRLQRIRLAYDPPGHFQRYWKGGFKLPEPFSRLPVSRDEL